MIPAAQGQRCCVCRKPATVVLDGEPLCNKHALGLMVVPAKQKATAA